MNIFNQPAPHHIRFSQLQVTPLTHPDSSSPVFDHPAPYSCCPSRTGHPHLPSPPPREPHPLKAPQHRRRGRSAPTSPSHSQESVIIVATKELVVLPCCADPFSPVALPQGAHISPQQRLPTVSFDKLIYPPTPDLTRVCRRRTFHERLPSPLSTPLPIRYQNAPRTGEPNPNYIIEDGVFLLKEFVDARMAD